LVIYKKKNKIDNINNKTLKERIDVTIPVKKTENKQVKKTVLDKNKIKKTKLKTEKFPLHKNITKDEMSHKNKMKRVKKINHIIKTQKLMLLKESTEEEKTEKSPNINQAKRQ